MPEQSYLCVLGNSVSAGTGLPRQSLAWPWIVAKELSKTRAVTVVPRHVLFAPVGPTATDYALSKVEESTAEIVIVVLGSYACAIATVSERVNQRWGKRAAKAYLKLEMAFEGRTGNRSSALASVNRGARWLARRTIGTARLASVEEVIGHYSEVLDGLAQSENVDVIVFPEPFWPDRMNRENPGANDAFGRIRHELRVVADRHHFRWTDPEPAFSEVESREANYQLDGTHKSEAGHRLLATALLEQLSSFTPS